MKRFLPIYVLLAISLLVAGCSDTDGKEDKDPDPTEVTTYDVVAKSHITAEAGGTVKSGFKLGEVGVCYSKSQSPTVGSGKVTAAAQTGTFSVTLSGLHDGDTYYARAYAINDGEFDPVYGSQVTFTMPAYGEPVMGTTVVGDVDLFIATVSSEISGEDMAEITERGFAYGKSQSPTVDGTKKAVGTGTGEFSTTLEGLDSGTTYYVRSYATNYRKTFYGPEASFTTESATENKITVVEKPGYDLADGTVFEFTIERVISGESILKAGIVYGTSPGLNVGNSTALEVTNPKAGEQLTVSKKFTEEEEYYFSAFVTTTSTTSYSTEYKFTTQQLFWSYFQFKPDDEDPTDTRSNALFWSSEDVSPAQTQWLDNLKKMGSAFGSGFDISTVRIFFTYDTRDRPVFQFSHRFTPAGASNSRPLNVFFLIEEARKSDIKLGKYVSDANHADTDGMLDPTTGSTATERQAVVDFYDSLVGATLSFGYDRTYVDTYGYDVDVLHWYVGGKPESKYFFYDYGKSSLTAGMGMAMVDAALLD